jgi:outer membrane lipoprotein-sorting protein
MTFPTSLTTPLTRRDALATLGIGFALIGAMTMLPRRALADLTPDDRADIGRIEQYLNGIHTIQSRFDQVSQSGAAATGMIYLQRPGHMRIQYDPPTPILMVATHGEVFYYDQKLDQISWVQLDQTPAWFLLQDQIHLGADIAVTDFLRQSDTLRLTLTEAKRAERGKVTLVLNDQPMELRQWTVIDAQNKTVTVTLNNPEYGGKIDQNLFVWHDPRSSNASSH